ncbi:MAG TPA: glycerol acyltransferase, partial [Bacteroidales bacterium]|nr:glycerol acyltransferase [Bacteroidales bacterium]
MYIDVDKAVKDKNPQLYKWLPSFVLNWIKRLIHQDEINEYLDNYKGTSSIEFAQSVISYFDVEIKINQEENLPKTGRYIVVSNHPLGGLDGLALIATLGKYRKDLKFPVNDLLMYLKELNEVFIPINKHGKNSL